MRDHEFDRFTLAVAVKHVRVSAICGFAFARHKNLLSWLAMQI